MYILGLDLSLSSCGWSIITEDETIIACDKICTDAKKNTEFERIQIVVNEIKELIETNSIGMVVAEDQFFSKNPKTGLTLSRLMGAVIYVCMELEVKLELLSSTNARKILLGNGRGTKSDMANWIRENHIDLGEFIDRNCQAKNSDKYDSLAVSLAWLKKYKLDKKYGTNK